MKHIKLLKYLNNYKTSVICKKYDIKNWSINSNGLVDVDGDVYLSNKGLDKLPLKFGKVTGHFSCSDNNLTSLEGVPKEVGVSFFCNNNQLVSLEGGPIKVGGNFYCNSNKLVSFEGVPDFVGGYFYCPINLIYNIWKLFRDYSKIELFNYYDIVRDLNGKPAIVLVRLNQFLEDIGKPPVKKVDGYINI